MFSELKKKQEEAKAKKNELIFDDLESQTSKLKLAEVETAKKDQSELLKRRKSVHKTINLSEYMSEMETKSSKRRSIKKSDQKPSTMSLNVGSGGIHKEKESVSSQRSNSLESPGLGGGPGQNVGLGIFEAATMMCNIVDITTDSTNKSFKNDKSKTLKSKESKTSLGSASGPFSQMKEAQEMKKKSKNSFDADDEDC
ncbi:Protein CBG09111 [Caenorhabditis briggsae]|nr:Protein CBG09111 [Caenorhabditis briggsae]CAP28682.2 Protein CBG09111 [Caenorhabditis briggsae]